MMPMPHISIGGASYGFCKLSCHVRQRSAPIQNRKVAYLRREIRQAAADI